MIVTLLLGKDLNNLDIELTSDAILRVNFLPVC